MVGSPRTGPDHVDSALPPPPPPPPTDEERFTPTPEDREAMLKTVSSILARRGPDALLRSPLLAPIPDHFPDPWHGDVMSARRVVRRLAHYAGLDVQRVRVHPWRADADGNLPAGGPTGRGEGNVWFRQRDAEGVLHFGLDVQQLRDAEATGSASARAVAHAWLAEGGEPVRVSAERLPLAIDITTVLLGFGVLTTQAAIAHKTGPSSGMSSQRKTTRLGVAGPIRMAWLLALHATLRGLGPRGQGQVAGLLNPNPATFYRASLDQLAPQSDALCERLRLPAEAARPPQHPIETFTGPLPEPESLPEDDETEPVEDPVRGMNVGRPVFRIQKTMAVNLARFFGLGTMVLGGFASRAVADAGLDMAQVTVTGLGLAVVGGLVGRFIPDHRCSEAKCGQRLPREATVCPRCGGTLAGTIAKATERLAAEERLAAAAEVPATPAGADRPEANRVPSD